MNIIFGEKKDSNKYITKLHLTQFAKNGDMSLCEIINEMKAQIMTDLIGLFPDLIHMPIHGSDFASVLVVNNSRFIARRREIMKCVKHFDMYSSITHLICCCR